MNPDLSPDIENWEVKPNSGNFEHSAYCRNQCPIEDRIYNFDIMNSRNAVEIRKEKKAYIYAFFRRNRISKIIPTCTYAAGYAFKQM